MATFMFLSPYSVYQVCCFFQHGRLKIKTTAEQQEEKRRERQKKLKIFRAALAKAFQKVVQYHHWISFLFFMLLINYYNFSYDLRIKPVCEKTLWFSPTSTNQ